VASRTAGWTIFERYLSAAVKHFNCLLSLQSVHELHTACTLCNGEWHLENILRKCRSKARPAPLPPDEFEDMLLGGVERERVQPGSGIVFTNGKDATEIILPTYRTAFIELLGHAELLWYGGLGWGDEQARQLARALQYVDAHLPADRVPMLEEIRLGSNQIGDDGLGALQRVIESECLPYLTVVDVVGKSGNCASKEAVLDLTDALRLQQLRQVKQLKMLYEGKQLAARVHRDARAWRRTRGDGGL
jgi:hypothetical protein